MTPADWQMVAASRDFLESFPQERRSHVANLFLGPVRRGCTDPRLVCRTVWRELSDSAERGRRWGHDVAREEAILAAMDAYRDAALAFAQWALDWEALPREERARRKRQRGDDYRDEWREQQPPTPEQEAYARGLGYAGPLHSRKHASAIIEVYLHGGRVEVAE